MSDFSIGGQKWPGIGKLAEEGGEVADILPELILMKLLGRLQQVNGKLIGSRGEIEHWDGSNLKIRLQEELGDLLAATMFVIKENDLDAGAIMTRRAAKIAIFDQWQREGQV